MIPFKGLEKLLLSRVLLGFDCIFDETKDLDAVATVYERFFDTYPNRYVCVSSSRPITAKSRGLVRHRVSHSLRKAYEIKLYDADPSQGYDWYGHTRMGLLLNLRGNDPKEIDPPVWSSQSLYLPKQEEPEHILNWSLEVGRTMFVRYGVAGWCLAPSFGQGRSRDEHEAARRAHPGLADWRIDYGIWRAKHGIRDTNWLTLVTNELLKKVGGIAGVRNKLSSRVVLHEVREGWLFQAGERPLVGGPGYEADDFGAYAEVARALAPCRDRVIGWDEETLRWMQRFDALLEGPAPFHDFRKDAARRRAILRALRGDATFMSAWQAFVDRSLREATDKGMPASMAESLLSVVFQQFIDDPAKLQEFRDAHGLGSPPPSPAPPSPAKTVPVARASQRTVPGKTSTPKGSKRPR